MLIAKKGNKEVYVDNVSRQRYANDGFTIYEDGRIVEYGRGATAPLPDFLALIEENARLKAEIVRLTAKQKKSKKK